ncbi:MAG: hypothetical protein ACFHX7_20855 [Pseudomonadota bacterium]
MLSATAVIYAAPLGILLVPSIYIFRIHHRLLLNGTLSTYFASACSIAAALGLLVATFSGFSQLSLAAVVVLASPLFQLAFFRYLFGAFVSKFAREPVDVAYNFASGLAADRAFAFAIVLGSIYVSFGAFAFFIWGVGSDA